MDATDRKQWKPAIAPAKKTARVRLRVEDRWVRKNKGRHNKMVTEVEIKTINLVIDGEPAGLRDQNHVLA